MTRPPLMSSIVSVILATRPGLRKPVQATSDPIWMRSVALARPAMMVKHSQTPRSSSSAGTWNWLSGCARNTRWSMIQTASRPASSAVRVMARMSAKWGVPPNAESSAIGRMTPMPIGRSLTGQRLSVGGCHRAGSVPVPALRHRSPPARLRGPMGRVARLAPATSGTPETAKPLVAGAPFLNL